MPVTAWRHCLSLHQATRFRRLGRGGFRPWDSAAHTPRPSLLTWQDIALTFPFPKKVVTNIPVRKRNQSCRERWARYEPSYTDTYLKKYDRRWSNEGMQEVKERCESLIGHCMYPSSLDVFENNNINNNNYTNKHCIIENGPTMEEVFKMASTGPIRKKMTT